MNHRVYWFDYGSMSGMKCTKMATVEPNRIWFYVIDNHTN